VCYYAELLLLIAAFVLVFRWREGAGKGIFASALLLMLSVSAVFRLENVLLQTGVIRWESAPTQVMRVIGTGANLASAILLVVFAVVGGRAVVLKEGVEAPEDFKGPMYLYIPVGRLVFMSLLSLGAYEAYWIYKNWRYLKERDGLKINPVLRGIFGIFFCHSLLKTIRNDERANAVRKAGFSAYGLATGWVVVVLIGSLLGRIPAPGFSLLGMLVSLPSFIFFLPVQLYINDLNGAFVPQPVYYKWSVGHTACLVFGIVFWPLVILRMFPR
jgi:hypothetical protein